MVSPSIPRTRGGSGWRAWGTVCYWGGKVTRGEDLKENLLRKLLQEDNDDDDDDDNEQDDDRQTETHSFNLPKH